MEKIKEFLATAKTEVARLLDEHFLETAVFVLAACVLVLVLRFLV